MIKNIYLIIFAVFSIPSIVLGIFRNQYPIDPDIVYVKSPNLFAEKWEKVGATNEFSQYIVKSRVIKNDDLTITVSVMRNYSGIKRKVKDDIKTQYHSEVVNMDINCFHQTYKTNKTYLLSGYFANGSLIEEPQEDFSMPNRVNRGTIGESLIEIACQIANYQKSSKDAKIGFMQDI
jgi:hypothetical protein